MIGRYHLLQRIGEPGMGEAWLGDRKSWHTAVVRSRCVKPWRNARSDGARRN